LLLLGEYGLQGYDGNFLYAIDRALALKGKDRPQSVQEFQYLLMGMERSETEERIRQNVLEDTYVPQVEEMSSDNISLSGFFSFDGVIHRLGYLLHSFFALLFLIAGIVVIVSTRNHYTEEPSEVGVLGLILFLIFSFWGGIAALVKRTRDIGQSIPLFIFLSMVPYVNVIIGLILLFTPSKFSEKYNY
jgi:uncharacterized membrane protein YhaH (DUF805 family)